ncbi:DUF5071 domain-containing protein [uncultured Ruminococcus sp.]|uniref:DUF5071 domain-containing protein n=1 Tax=uncultured Ruminococcus sp. TaxID=165186 RepID=UPI0025D807EE|nr:DUF5071 domain-containing protein [uncultured Ruminococcus sp.]
MMNSELIPKDKFDISSFEKLMALSDDEIDALIPPLLEWIQDMNWTVSSYMVRVLSKHRRAVEKYLPDLLKPQQTDNEWKRNIIRYLLSEWSAADERITAEIKRIAEHPTDGERLEAVDEAANEYLKHHS